MNIAISLCIFVSFVALGDSLLCQLKWPNCGLTVQNIVCERGETCPAEEGCENVESDAEFLKWILHEHNRLRNEVATGKESRGFTGPAANMMTLSYDKDLEFTAACNANRCKFEHDKCRGTKRFPAAGQNLFYATGNGSELRQAVTAWFEEIKLSTPDVIDKFPRDRDEISKFSQMIWASTTHIGCARAKRSDANDYFLVCNYGPEGNKKNHKVYERGAGCSKCPLFVKCNEQYPALCGEIDQSELGPGTGGSGVVSNKEEPAVEKTQDKNDLVATGGGAGGAPAVPGVPLGGFGGLGLGGLGGPSGSQGEQDKNEDNNEKKTSKETDSTTQQTGETVTQNTESAQTGSTNESSATESTDGSTSNDVTSTTDAPSSTMQSTTMEKNTTFQTTPQQNATARSLRDKLKNYIKATSKPDSAYVEISSNRFIFSLAFVSLGYWYFI